MLFLTSLFQNLPNAALAGVVLVAAFSLFDIPELRRVWVIDRVDFWLAMITAVLVIIFGMLVGIVVAVSPRHA